MLDKDGLYSVDLPYACYGIVIENGVVIEAANIAGWMTGKRAEDVERWLIKKNAKMIGPLEHHLPNS